MTLVEIDLSKEPVCLQELWANTVMTYENDLKDECRAEVVELLKNEQKNLCAYCQKNIENVINIEHYIAQSDILNNDHNLQLSFSNFLGVCTGKLYLNRETGTHERHCDTNRGNIHLRIDPRIHTHVLTISYTDDFRIISSNQEMNSDLNNVLNLNIDGICELRQKTFNEYFVRISEYWSENLVIEFYRKALRDMENNPPEYYGYIKYRFTQLIENEINRIGQ